MVMNGTELEHEARWVLGFLPLPKAQEVITHHSGLTD